MIEVEQQGNVVIVHMREDVWRGDAGLRGAGGAARAPAVGQ
jgi:hypothetical protein